MKTATALSCLLLTPWLLAHAPLFHPGEDALRSDNTEDDSFEAGGSTYDPSEYNGGFDADDNTIETDAGGGKADSIEGGSKGGADPEDKPKGEEKGPGDLAEEGSFQEEGPVAGKTKKSPPPKKEAKE